MMNGQNFCRSFGNLPSCAVEPEVRGAPGDPPYRCFVLLNAQFREEVLRPPARAEQRLFVALCKALGLELKSYRKAKQKVLVN